MALTPADYLAQLNEPEGREMLRACFDRLNPSHILEDWSYALATNEPLRNAMMREMHASHMRQPGGRTQ
jgi:hypothetical protein